MKPDIEKKYLLKPEDFKQLISPIGSCYASDQILVDGKKVGYMIREEPSDTVSSGWTFMSGDESQEYADDPTKWAIYDVNTICNYDPSIIQYLDSKIGTAYGRDLGADGFQEEPLHPNTK